MSKPLVDRIPFAKIMIVLVIVFGVSLGLCGVSAALGIAGSSHMRNSGGQLLGFSFVIEIIAIVLSSVGLVVTVIAWVILSIAGNSSRNDPAPRQLLDDPDDRDKSQ
jgi:hypothetical protein